MGVDGVNGSVVLVFSLGTCFVVAAVGGEVTVVVNGTVAVGIARHTPSSSRFL